MSRRFVRVVASLLLLPVVAYGQAAANRNAGDWPRPGGAQHSRDLTIDIIPLYLKRPARRPPPIEYKLFPGVDSGASKASGRNPSIPIITIKLAEGPVLETLVWGGTGALIGSFTGPAGTVMGAAIGAAGGFVLGLIYSPKYSRTPAGAS